MSEYIISVIIPTCNGSNNIKLAVKSVLAQTISDVEIIIVDDNGIGSLEQKNTENSLKEYESRNNIKYICHECNSGGSVARNTGANNSDGKYLVFLDDDDVLLPNMLEKQLSLLKKTKENVAMAVCSGYYTHKDGRGYIRKLKTGNINLLRDYLLDKEYFNTSTIMIKKDIYCKIGGFDESFDRHQDWEFCVRVLSSFDAKICEQPLIVRYFEDRHSPKTIEQREKYLNYFFMQRGKMIEKKLGKKDFLKVRNYKYSQIAIQLYLSGKFYRGIKFLLRNQCGVRGVFNSFTYGFDRVFDRLKNGGKIVTDSQQQMSDKFDKLLAE